MVTLSQNEEQGQRLVALLPLFGSSRIGQEQLPEHCKVLAFNWCQGPFLGAFGCAPRIMIGAELDSGYQEGV